MSEPGFVRFPAGSLDPGAQEFIPRNPIQITHFRPPPPLQPPLPVYYPYPPPTITEVVPYPTFSAPATYVSSTPETISVPLPPPAAAATRAVMLSSVPSDVSEMTVWREMEGFGEVRWVQMERACEGIVTVHFYDLRHAESALREIRDQYMQHQGRLRGHYSAVFMSPPPSSPPNLFGGAQETHHHHLHHDFLNPYPSPPGRGLILGHAVWPQFVYPVLTSIPDGLNQGTIVIFNLDPAVTTSALRDIFQAFGAVKELRETPSKKHQRFVEFFDVRDAAKALIEMNGKEINGKPAVIEFSRPGGHSRKFFNAAVNNTPTVVSTNSTNVNLHPHDGLINFPHQPPPQELGGKFSRRTNNPLNVVPPRLLTRNKWSNNASNVIVRRNNGSPSGSTYSSSSSSVETKMAVLNLNGGEETGKPKRSLKKSGQKGENSGTQAVAISPRTQQQGKSSSRGKKGRQAKKLDSRFLIKEDAISESTCGDSRTTVMIKNIPNKYSQKLLLNMLDNHCIHSNEKIVGGGGGEGDDDEPVSAYDFVYLPIDFNNKCNVGYGFVNMTSPEATLRLYKAFHLQHWEVFNSRKICEVTYARVQGLDALKEHFKNSKFPCEMEHYLPVVFSPPRDGRLLTEPLPIVAPPIQNNHHHSNDDAHPVSLLLPPLQHQHQHQHQHHDVDTDAPVSAGDSDEDSSGNGGVTADDDETK